MAVIGIMDSGIGGLSVFKEIQKVLPSEHYIYYADTEFCPYGEKKPEFIRERCAAISDEMLRKGVDIMVIACNTATAAAITYLRDSYKIPFIGMEPAVKPAALGTKSGVIGVLATAGTLKGSKYLNTRDKYSSNIRIVENVGLGFVEIVEKAFCGYNANSEIFDKQILNSDESKTVVEKSLSPLLKEGADTIVLGCTHYPFLLETMREIAGPDIHFIDPAPAVASHLVDLLNEREIPLNMDEGSFEFLSSKTF